jgi:hypothetical protein
MIEHKFYIPEEYLDSYNRIIYAQEIKDKYFQIEYPESMEKQIIKMRRSRNNGQFKAKNKSRYYFNK